jgi:flagellar basal-body rod protein FlgC
MQAATSGMMAQNVRVRIISQNIANAQSLATEPGGRPYQRQTVSFKNAMDRASGIEVVEIDRIGVDRAPFGQKFDPGHPAADQNGYVQLPNVKPLIEMVDLRQAQRSYEANLRVVDVTRTMVARTIDLLR